MKRQLNSTRRLSTESSRRLLVCAFALALAAIASAPAAQAPAPTPHAGAAPVPEIRFVKSDFVTTPGFGKDPFFPKSIRINKAIVALNPIDTAPSFGFLTLKGVSGPKNHRLAIIAAGSNNRTFEPGEEAEMKTPNGQSVKVKCVEIRDDGVVVSIGGQTQKLYLTKL